MLVIRAVQDLPDRGIRKDDEFRLYIVDAHHHMGREKSHRNTPSGAYDFYTQLWFELQKKAEAMLESDRLLFEPIRVEVPPMASGVFQSRTSWNRMNHGWLVDRTVVFPYTDDYSSPSRPDEPTFRVSNDKIAGWTTRAPHSTRLIGYGRVNPLDGDSGDGAIAVRELERCVTTLGLRGLKLHPLAQLFLDSIDGPETWNVVKRAGELEIPVIFDTRNIRTVERIHSLVDSMRNDPDCGNAIKGLRVIIAHCGMSPSDPRLFDALKDPIIYTETSTLHDLDVPALFETALERLHHMGDRWSNKILFGTDFSFLSVQAADVILYLLSRDFGGTLADVQKILGGNSLIVTQRAFRRADSASVTPVEMFCHDKDRAVQRGLESAILEHVGSGEWGLSSLDVMLPPENTWPKIEPLEKGGFNGVYLDSYLLTLKSKQSQGDLHVWIRRRAGGLVSCSVLGPHGSATIESLEYASQKMSWTLTQALSHNSHLARDAGELVAELESLVK
ncbi:MAG: amidohydrolase family protein [Candidatus Thorarchaeota archaeon]